MNMIPFQPEFRPALPVVFGSKDYHEFRSILEEMDRILIESGLEDNFIIRHLDSCQELSNKPRLQSVGVIKQALRCCILLAITGESFRKLSLRIADSTLFQWFTGMAQVDGIRSVSKSTLERYEKEFSSEEIGVLIHDLNRAVSDERIAKELLLRETRLHLNRIFADTTCVKANIHFPVDWVLLRDAVRTLILAIELIRSYGIKHRISEPAVFLRKMNKLCIEMTHIRKKPDAPKKRKQVLRRMKKLTTIVQKHAKNYHHALETNWQNAGISEAKARVILDRIEGILSQLPQAIKQAHERIIGSRRVKNSEKILSLYESEIHVMVRGKSGAEVEFGNPLYLAEQEDGLIVDWNFSNEKPTGDNKLTEESISRISAEYGKPESYATDRGFDSPDNRIDLEELGIINAICPRSVLLFKEKLKDELFCSLQKRRGATEARIGIFKNAYLGTPLRSKGFKNRRTRIEWCILAHNLWKIATMAAESRKEQKHHAEKAA